MARELLVTVLATYPSFNGLP